MLAIASRIAARSATAGTPVKSCSSTRPGMKAISTLGSAVDSQRAMASMSSAGTMRPSSRAQEILQQDLQGVRKACHRQARCFQCRQVSDPEGASSRTHRSFGAEAVRHVPVSVVSGAAPGRLMCSRGRGPASTRSATSAPKRLASSEFRPIPSSLELAPRELGFATFRGASSRLPKAPPASAPAVPRAAPRRPRTGRVESRHVRAG